MNIIILGAGISGVALAHFLQEKKSINKITLLEKDSKPGGLLRSYNVKGIAYDIGPHIIFSKHKEILDKNIKISFYTIIHNLSLLSVKVQISLYNEIFTALDFNFDLHNVHFFVCQN